MQHTYSRPLHAGSGRRARPTHSRQQRPLRLDRTRDVGPLVAGDAGSGHAHGQWDPTPTAQWVAPVAPVGLVTPRVSPEIPRTLTLRRPAARAAILAEALLAEGILQESDWAGDVVTSIACGVQRWALGILGGQDLQRIELGLHWGDDLQAVSGMDPSLWIAAKPDRTASEPVGLLALQTGHQGELGAWPAEGDCIVGPTVLELEAVRRGLGFQVLALLADVLPPLIGTATPHYALAELEKLGGLEMELRGGRIGGTMFLRGTDRTPERLFEQIPRQACIGELKPDVLRRARSFSLSPRHREIIERALDVLGRFQALRADTRQCDASILCAPTQTVGFVYMPGMAAKLPSFCLRWSCHDLIPAVVESYLRQLNGRGTNLAWCQAWQVSSPASIRRAARNWRAVTSVVLRACQLAELMHSESEAS